MLIWDGAVRARTLLNFQYGQKSAILKTSMLNLNVESTLGRAMVPHCGTVFKTHRVSVYYRELMVYVCID